MSKIGVVTFDNTIDNYGQVLQYLATQEYLKSLGHKVTLVHPTGIRRTFKRRVIWKFTSIYWRIKNILLHKAEAKIDDVLVSENSNEELQKKKIFDQWAEVTFRLESERPRHFEEFRQKYFSRQYGTYDDIIDANYDAYCVGSDQTWSDAGYHMMLGWTPEKARRFSLAPSVGHRKYEDYEIKTFIPYLKRFDFVTVREDNGLNLCEKCGYIGAKKILDPTFLLDSSIYDKYVKNKYAGKTYVFVYMLGGEISIPVKDIISFCKSNNMDVKYVESQGRDEKIESIPASVGEWLGLMKNASYVITNSFHGMAFSIIYHKPFVIFPLVGLMERMNGRINDLTLKFGLQNRIYNDSLDLIKEPIDWERIDCIIEDNRHTFRTLLRNIGL